MTKILKLLFPFIMVWGLTPVTKGADGDFVNSSTDKSLSDSITISGCFRNMTADRPRTVTIIECDISDKNVRELCELDSNNSFSMKIPLSYPHTFTVCYNERNYINAFAAPGDTIYMDIDASSSPLSVNFNGDKAEINQQYDPAYQYISHLLYSVELPSDTVALERYLPVFKKYVKQGNDSIDKYAQEHDLSDKVVSMLYADNLYILANLALGYQGKNIEEKRAFFLDPIFDIFNEENTKVMIFPYHISAIMNHFPDVRDSAPKGIVRDIMYACDEDAPVPDRSIFYNEAYYDRLYSQNEDTEKISIDNISTGNAKVYVEGKLREISDENPVRWLINEYQGHPIYLDISATWCGPCRAGLKESESLRKYFKDTDIRFAVIWLRSPEEDWIKVAPTISKAIQIFIDDVEMTDRLMGHLKFNGFPTYLMIDKDGNITKDGVPSYLSPELLQFLNNYKNE